MNVENAFRYVDNFKKQESVESVFICGNTIANPKVTIAIPTYKRAETIIDTLQSAIKQQNIPSDKYEILIVDNDPTRNCATERLIQNLCIHNDNIRYYKNSDNLGLLGNWNRCFELALSEWVVLLHDDDFIFPFYLERMLKALKKQKDVAILKPKMENRYENDQLYSLDIPSIKWKNIKYQKVVPIDYVFMGNYMGAPTGCMFNKHVVHNIGGFNVDLFPSADTMLILYVAMSHKVLLLRKILGVQRIGRNESLKKETLEKFMQSRYLVMSFLARYYKLNSFIGKKYYSYSMTKFYLEIKSSLSEDFEYKLSDLDKDLKYSEQYLYGKACIGLYRIKKAIASVLF